MDPSGVSVNSMVMLAGAVAASVVAACVVAAPSSYRCVISLVMCIHM